MNEKQKETLSKIEKVYGKDMIKKSFMEGKNLILSIKYVGKVRIDENGCRWVML